MKTSGRAISSKISLAVIAASLTLTLSVEASTVGPNFQTSSTEITKTTATHSIFLKCKINENWITQSKGAILKVPKALTKSKNDFAIVTGHGLNEQKDCFVSDFHGNSKKVLTKTFAKNYKAGTKNDWALISFKRIKGSHIIRYDLESYLDEPSSLHHTPISFARARGLPENSQRCKLAVVTLNTHLKTPPIFSHDCRVTSGQSGSPITQNNNGRHELIGFHLGHMWTVQSPITGKPGKFNFFRPYDKDMSDEIKHVLKEFE